jgi:Fur family transcriptional regulator, ferric uptake regulator
VYRALGLLVTLGVLQRVPVAGGSARYELVGPGGDHHHHLVCDDCGATTAFEDDGLERAIGRISRRTAYSVQAHDVTLHGTCPECQRS